MFSDIFAFGDSFIAGTELAAETIPGLRETLIKKFNVVYKPDGRIHNLDNLHNAGQIHSYVHNELISTFGQHKKGQLPADHKLSFVNKVAQSLGIPAYNCGIPGSGMVSIVHQLTINLDAIKQTKKPFVIIGITGTSRLSKFDSIGVKNILPYYRDPRLSKSQQQDLDAFNRLSFEFGDDVLSRLTHRTSHICLMAYLLRDIPHMFIDSYGDVTNEEIYNSFFVNNYNNSSKEQIQERDIRKDYAKLLREVNTDHIFPTSICELANAAGTDSYCLFWHPREHIHQIMADQIVDYIGKKYA